MDAQQLLEYAEENWLLESMGKGNYRVTVAWDDIERVGLLSFAVDDLVLIGCPIANDALEGSTEIAEMLEAGSLVMLPSPDGLGTYIAQIAEIESLTFQDFDKMLDHVFDTVDSTESAE